MFDICCVVGIFIKQSKDIMLYYSSVLKRENKWRNLLDLLMNSELWFWYSLNHRCEHCEDHLSKIRNSQQKQLHLSEFNITNLQKHGKSWNAMCSIVVIFIKLASLITKMLTLQFEAKSLFFNLLWNPIDFIDNTMSHEFAIYERIQQLQRIKFL